MEATTQLHFILVISWFVVYGGSIVMAVAQYESATDKQYNTRKKLFWKSLPYAISLVPTLYQSFKGQDLVNGGLFAITFLVLTWVLVFAVRKQWQRGT